MNWIVVADNSIEALQDAGHILCKRKMRVTGFRSGQALMEFLKDNWPDLKNTIKDEVHRFIFEKIKRNPMILPIILDV